MSNYFCAYYFDHEPGTVCPHCVLEVDDYGNTEEDFINCCFPDCGCDGQRLCMAPSGANENAQECNVEGMWNNGDSKSIKARIKLYGLVHKRPSQND